jgi:hypothetical protein
MDEQQHAAIRPSDAGRLSGATRSMLQFPLKVERARPSIVVSGRLKTTRLKAVLLLRSWLYHGVFNAPFTGWRLVRASSVGL